MFNSFCWITILDFTSKDIILSDIPKLEFKKGKQTYIQRIQFRAENTKVINKKVKWSQKFLENYEEFKIYISSCERYSHLQLNIKRS